MRLQAGKYNWMTYKEVYDLVIKVGASIRSCGVEQVMLPASTWAYLLPSVSGKRILLESGGFMCASEQIRFMKHAIFHSLSDAT